MYMNYIFAPVKPCCWCGRRPLFYSYKNKRDDYRHKAGCKTCGDFTRYFDTEDEALKAWNNEESILSAKGPALVLNI